MMRMLAGSKEPKRRKIELAGQNIAGRSPEQAGSEHDGFNPMPCSPPIDCGKISPFGFERGDY